MQVLKIIAISLATIIGLMLIVAIFTKKDYSVTREVTIDKPVQVVFNFIKLLKNQERYSAWATKDTLMKHGYKGIDGTIGAIASWESENKNVGSGEQEITAMQNGIRIDYELRFFEPFESKDKAFMTTNAITPNQTLVRWGFNGSMKYPMNLMLLFMDMEKTLGDDLQLGLDNLKRVMEQ